MQDSIKHEIESLLDHHRIMSLATLRPDGWPQATTVGYVNEGLSLYFQCGLDSQKARNLAKDDRVSLSINNDPDDIMHISGVSMAGHAKPVADPEEASRIIVLGRARYPASIQLPMPMPTPDQIHSFKVTPSIVSLLDYSQEFGHTDLVAV